MSELIELKRLERKLRRESLADGLAEIFTGLLLLAVALMLQKDLNIIPYLFFMLFGSAIVRALRRYITYPRMGYVELPQSPTRPATIRLYIGLAAAILLVFILELVLSGDIGQARLWYRWMPLPFGLVMVVIFVSLGRWANLWRYYLLAIVSLAAGILFTILRFDWKLEGLSRTAQVIGLAALALGLALLVVFLIRHPVIEKRSARQEGSK